MTLFNFCGKSTFKRYRTGLPRLKSSKVGTLMLFPSKFTKLLFGDESVKVLNRYVDFKKYLFCYLSVNSIPFIKKKEAALNHPPE